MNGTVKDGEFNLDDDVDLKSPLLSGVLSDGQPGSNPENDMTSATTTTHTVTKDLQPTNDDWENM